MRRDNEQDDSQVAGQDSFLDVVANIVGILILLVMVVGLRAARETQEETLPAEPAQPAVTMEDAQRAERVALQEQVRVERLIQQVHQARRGAMQFDAQRVDLATFVAESKQKIEEKKQRLSVDQRRDLQLREQLNVAQMNLEDLAREQVTLASYDPQVESIESLPTPLAKSVSGEEVHIRLAGGKAAVVPLDQLLEGFGEHAQANMWRLEARNQASVVIGPIDGFRLRYTLRKSLVTVRSGAQATLVQLVRWRLLPDAAAEGTPVEQALEPGSRLMRQVKQRSPDSTTITIWTYPDSFNEFRQLKRALFDLGYATAGRPLPEGVLIGGSPNGTQSAAQ